MHRTFQSAVTLFSPEHIFILGDIFDEGNWVDSNQFREYMDRFAKLFYVPPSVQVHALAGNHDVGFHYATRPFLVNRFYSAFNTSGVRLLTIRDIHFISINSVAMESDGCVICEQAERELAYVSYQLNCTRGVGDEKSCAKLPKLAAAYSQPIVLQHYPLYRRSDAECLASDMPKLDKYRERWEVLSRDSTKLIGRLLEPRLAFSGHTHYYCHSKNRVINVEEYTIPSFSWRNKNDPSFLLAQFTPATNAVYKCDMPKESTVIRFYVFGVPLCFILPLISLRSFVKPIKFLFSKR